MRVLGADGIGAEGAEVRVLRPDQGGLSPTAAILVDTTTIEGGFARSPVPRLAGLTVVIDHPLHLPFVASFPGAPLPGMLTLQSGTAATGEVVTGETAAPVAGAEVCASWVDEQAPERFQRWRRCAASDDAGRFRIAGIPPRGVDVTVAASGFRERVAPLDDADSPVVLALDPVDPMDRLAAAPADAGRVLVEVVGFDGNPVERFTMRVQIASGGRTGGTAVTVEQTSVPAEASIPSRFLGAGMAAVTFEAENHLRSAMQGVQLQPGGEVDLGVVFLEPGAVVTGRIFDAVGAEPAAGCLAELLPPGAGELRAMLLGIQSLAVSDEEGRYLLGGLPEGRYHLRRQCVGAPTLDSLVVLDASERLDLGETWLGSDRRVEVLVDGVDGGVLRVFDRFKEITRPIAEAVFVPVGGGGGADGEQSSSAEIVLAGGTYRFEILGPGRALRASREATIVPDGTANVQSVGLSAAGRAIRSVLTMAGRPVAGGSVALGPVLDSARSSGTIMVTTQAGGADSRRGTFQAAAPSLRANVGNDGAFVVEGASDGFLWLTWYAPDGTTVSRLWPEGAVPQFDLGGTGVSGVLLDGDGVPVQGGSVALIGSLGRTVATGSSLAGGGFELPPAPPGEYLLRGRSDAGSSVAVEVELASEAPRPVVLRMPGGEPGDIALSLRRPGGAAVAGAWVHLVDGAGDVAGTGLTSERGRYANSGIPAGELSVVWNDGTSCVGGRTITVEGGESARLELTLPAGRLLELRCPAEDCGGEPLSFLSVRTESGVEIAGHLTGAAGNSRFSDDGALGVGCVTPDTYGFSFWTAGRRWHAEVEVGADGPPETPVAVRGRPAGL